MKVKRLRDRFVGCALGGAAASAAAYPYEGYSPGFLSSLDPSAIEGYEAHRSGHHPAGQYTGDVQNFLATAEALLEAGGVDGEAIAGHLVPLWRDQLVLCRDATSAAAMRPLVEGRVTWADAGQAGPFPDNGPVGRATVVGLWDTGRFERIPFDVETACRITHADPRAAAAAAAYAAAIAYLAGARELILAELIDRAAAACVAHPAYAAIFEDLPRFLALEATLAQEEIRRLAAEDCDAGDGMPPHALATVVLALLSFLKAPYDYARALFGCLREGGDVDTTCFLAGSLAGAFNGPSIVPRPLREGLVERDRIVGRAAELAAARARIDPSEGRPL